MNQRETILGLSSQWIATGYVGAVSVVLNVLLARNIGPEFFGDYSYYMTIGSLVMMVQGLGFAQLIYREGACASLPGVCHDSGGLFGTAVGYLLAATIAVQLLLFVLPMPDWRIFAPLLFFFSFQYLTELISANLRACGAFAREAVWRMAVRTSGVVGIVVMLYLYGLTVQNIFLGLLGGVGLLLLFASPVKIPRPALDGLGNRHVRQAVLCIFAIEVATNLYYRSDILLLKYIGSGPLEVGYYSAAYRFINGITLVTSPLAVVWFRKMRINWQDPVVFWRIVSRICRALVLVALCLVGLAWALSREVVLVTFGPDFAASAGILPWLSLSLVFLLPNMILTQGVITLNSERTYAVGAAICVAINIGLNFLLIPTYGGRGAAWSTLATEAFLTCFLLHCISRRGKEIAHHAD
jgi:O-antigen/teichoic acid export membrane protein